MKEQMDQKITDLDRGQIDQKYLRNATPFKTLRNSIAYKHD